MTARLRASNLGELFACYVDEAPGDLAIDTVDGLGQPISLSRAALASEVRAAAAGLLRAGIRPGDRVLIAQPNGLGFVVTFWATQWIGGVAVPVPPIEPRRGLEEQRDRLARIARSAGAETIVCPDDRVQVLRDGLPTLGIVADADLRGDEAWRAPATPSPAAAAVFQLTSGSTERPRACMLTHDAILSNARAIVDKSGGRVGDASVIWLPLHHDMGLMSGVVVPVAGGLSTAIQSPSSFTMAPTRWLRRLAQPRRAHTAIPNFALGLIEKCLLARPADFDLSGVMSIVCGGEAIDAEAARSFLRTLEPFGLSPEALHPAYGLAECTVMVSSRRGLSSLRLDLAALATGVLETAAPGPGGAEVVSLGTPVEGAQIDICDDRGRVLGEGGIGEVVVRSPGLMKGYFEASHGLCPVAASGHATGDLGFMREGELYVVGRKKDLIIVGGANYVPSDIEAALSRALGIDRSRCAAIGVRGDLGTEKLVVICEVRGSTEAARVMKDAPGACYAAHGIFPAEAAPVPIGALPRTTSGKIRRTALRDLYLQGALARLAAPPERLSTMGSPEMMEDPA